VQQEAALRADPAIAVLTEPADILGECPTWAEEEQALYWIDVRGKAIRRRDHATGEIRSWPTPDLIGCFSLRARGGAVVGLRSGVATFDFSSGAFEMIFSPHAVHADMRFNDGRCDRQGRFWAGTMNDVTRQPVGYLYRIDARGASVMLDLVAVPNSLCWSPDGTVMYFADGREPVIWAFDMDTETGDISNRREFARMVGEGVPDGATVDAEGFVWSAQYGGAVVNRFAPDGTLVRSIPMPVTQPTCVTFGGPDYSTLFITTARQRLAPEALAKEPSAGSVLAIEPGMCGLPEPRFAL
jgi:sugar lactone lactonase YvrE